MKIWGFESLEKCTKTSVTHTHFQLLSTPAALYNLIHVYVYHFLCILGVLANICIVIVLWQPSMRKNPFNLFLIAIAICDGLLMLSYLIFKQVSFEVISFNYLRVLDRNLSSILLQLFVDFLHCVLCLYVCIFAFAFVVAHCQHGESQKLKNFKLLF